jgi:probable rRNA maturation factor
MAIDVFAADEQEQRSVDVRRFGDLTKRVLDSLGLKGDVEVSLLFVDEGSMAELNERFLGESGPTDVLAFPIEDDPEPSGRSPDEGGTGPGGPAEDPEVPLMLGDVVICPAVAHRNAKVHGVAYEAEVELLVVHGLLHLLGMDHEEDDEAELMEKRQSDLLARFGSQSG